MISTEKDNLEHLIDSLGYIIKLENLNIMNSFNEHVLPMVNDFLKNNLEIIQFVGICPIDDLFEYSSTESIATLIPIYLPFMIQNTVSKDPFLRQASLFGLKVCLERHTEHCKSSLEVWTLLLFGTCRILSMPCRMLCPLLIARMRCMLLVLITLFLL